MLTGEVEWQFQKQSAEDDIQKLSGVRGIINDIAIRPPVQAKDVKKNIEDALRRRLEGEMKEVSVVVQDGGKVILEGFTDNWNERRAIKARAIKARDPLLQSSCGTTEAFHIICNECLYQLISNKSGVEAHAAEALHQARVALRRFDAAVKLFAKTEGKGMAAKVNSTLKWIGDQLAGARELDVFIADVLISLRAKHPNDSSVENVYRACIRQRETAYVKANAALTSQRFRRFLIDVAEWIETASQPKMAGSRLEGQSSASDLASKTLSKIWSKMKRGKRIDELDLQRLHKFRLRAKRMRYTIKFTRSLYDANPRRIDRALKQLGKLQSALGQINDIASGKAILDRIGAQSATGTKRRKPPGMSRSTSKIFGDEERQKSRQLKRAAKAFEKLEAIKPFWA